MRKKALALTLAAVMGLSLTACGGEEGGGSKGDGVSITIFNSKVEVQSQFEEMAEEYTKATGVNVESITPATR